MSFEYVFKKIENGEGEDVEKKTIHRTHGDSLSGRLLRDVLCGAESSFPF